MYSRTPQLIITASGCLCLVDINSGHTDCRVLLSVRTLLSLCPAGSELSQHGIHSNREANKQKYGVAIMY